MCGTCLDIYVHVRVEVRGQRSVLAFFFVFHCIFDTDSLTNLTTWLTTDPEGSSSSLLRAGTISVCCHIEILTCVQGTVGDMNVGPHSCLASKRFTHGFSSPAQVLLLRLTYSCPTIIIL